MFSDYFFILPHHKLSAPHHNNQTRSNRHKFKASTAHAAILIAFALTAYAAQGSTAKAQTTTIDGTGGAGPVTASGTYTINAGDTLTFVNGGNGGAAIINSSGTFSSYGNVQFNDTSSAGNANITNNNGGLTYFNNTSTAGNANITNSYGNAYFRETSTAGSANITNSGGYTYFSNTSTAGNANIINRGASSTFFHDSSTAGNANIINNTNGSTSFYATSIAGNARITNNSDGNTYFYHTSTAGNAQLINNGAGSFFDFSGTTGPNNDGKISAGSIAGDGAFRLGRNTLTVGSNNLSTTVSGIIQDGGSSGGTGASLVKAGTGTLTLAGVNTYTGDTTVSGGILQAGIANTFAASANVTVASGATLDLNGFNQTLLGLNNSGTVSFGASAPGTVLTVQGNYVGSGGTIVLNTYLGGDSSASDRLIIDGAGNSAAGNTLLDIRNVGGPGAQTTSGILVVQTTNGATTASNAFTLAHRVAAGAYDYNLVDDNQNWYLRSYYVTPAADPGSDPSVSPGSSGSSPAVREPRPEIPTNAAIMALASQYGFVMLGTADDRGGSFAAPGAQSTGNSSGQWMAYDQRAVTCGTRKAPCATRAPLPQEATRWVASGWAQVIGGRGLSERGNFFRHGPDYDYSFGGIKAGLDVFAHEAAAGGLDKVGLYLGYGQISASIDGPKGAHYGKKAGSVDMDAYTLGGYWTHTAPQGWYTDATLQATWYRDTRARSVLNETLTPDGFGIIASLEGGYQFKLGSGWSLTPQAQLAYENTSFDNARDSFGIFRFEDGDSLRARIGARLARSWNMADAVHPRLMSIYLRANLWHEFLNNSKTSVIGFNGENALTTPASLKGTWAEITAGASAQVADHISLFGNANYQHSIDGKDMQSWGGKLGINVRW